MAKIIQKLTEELKKQLIVVDKAWQDKFTHTQFDSADLSLVLTEDNKVYGWLSLWWKSVACFERFKTGGIGHYYASSSSVSERMLTQAQKILQEQKIEYVIAPIDGDTWHSYRLSGDGVSKPQFFLDLATPTEWNEYFINENFSPIAQYYSSCTENLSYHDPVAIAWQNRLLSQERFKLSPFDIQRTNEQLFEVYQLSLRGFQKNLFYSDIGFDAFKTLYEPVLAIMDPDLIQMVYDKNQLVGFVFSIPDYLQKKEGKTIDTMILKSIVRDPSCEYKGLGAFLIWHSHQIAKNKGYQKMINAFMHEQNTSLYLSKKAGHHPIREYVLYGKQLS